MLHGGYILVPDFWTWLNNHAGVLSLAVAIITLGVAVITGRIADKTQKSQLRSEKLQEQTKVIQEEAMRIQRVTYDSQKRTTEIQDRLDARDLEFRKSQAVASLGHLLRNIRSAANRASIDNPAPSYDEIIGLMNGWQGDLMYLPDCKFKSLVSEELPGLVAPGNGTSVGGDHMKRVAYKLNQIRDKLADEQIEVECREKIKNML